MNGVAERVEDGCDLDIQLRRVPPHVAGRYSDELSKAAVAMNAHSLGVRAELAASGKAVTTATADQVTFNADQVTFSDGVDARTNGCYVTGNLVPEHDGRRHHRPDRRVPRPDVQVGATDAGARHLDQHLTPLHLRLGNVDQVESR